MTVAFLRRVAIFLLYLLFYSFLSLDAQVYA